MSGFVCLEGYPEYYFSQCYPASSFTKQVLGINSPEEISCASIETVDINEAKSTLYLFYFDNFGRIEYVYACVRGLSNHDFSHGLLEINHNSGRDVKIYFQGGRFRLSGSGESLSYDLQGRLSRVSGYYGVEYDYSVRYDVQGRLITYGPRSFIYDDISGLLREIRGDEGYNCHYDYITHGYGNDSWTHRVEKVSSGRRVLERHTFKRYVKRGDSEANSRLDNFLYSIRATDNCICQFLG